VLKPGGTLACVEYTMPAKEDLTADEFRAFDDVIQGSAMTSMPLFRNGKFGELLQGAGFENVEVQDLSVEIEPMLKAFSILGKAPLSIAKRLGQESHSVNAMAGVEFYRHRNVWRYVVAVGKKPSK
jgi:hypothetical protein